MKWSVKYGHRGGSGEENRVYCTHSDRRPGTTHRATVGSTRAVRRLKTGVRGTPRPWSLLEFV